MWLDRYVPFRRRIYLEAFKKKIAKQKKDNSYFILQSFLTLNRTFNEMLPVQKKHNTALSYT